MLKKKRVSVIYDPSNDYSRRLYDLFSSHFPDSSGDVIVDKEPYSVYNRDSLSGFIHATLRGEPDLIFFAGYSLDLNTVLQALPDSGNIDVIGANALYQNQQAVQIGHRNFYFTAFAYPDEWTQFQPSAPVFFHDYANDFDPQNTHSGTYGYARANDSSMIGYDAVETFLTASTDLKSSYDFTMESLQKVLTAVTYNGVTGLIRFNNQGNVDQKPVVIIQFDRQLHNQYRGVEGCYRQGGCYAI